MKPAIVTVLELKLGDRVTPQEREEIADAIVAAAEAKRIASLEVASRMVAQAVTDAKEKENGKG